MSEGLSRERIGGGASRGSAGSFLPAKRPRTDITDHGSERRLFRISEESDDGDKEVDAERKLMQFSTARAAVNGSHWRLARDHSVADNEVYLSEQLEHVAALAAIMEGNQRGLQSEEQGRECTLRVSALWQLVCGGKSGLTKKEAVEADKHIRDTMDTISFLLHVRNQEVDHQNYLGEKTRMLEKEAERKQHVIQTLRAEVESQKQTIAHQQNKLKAEEEASKAEKKALQTEKKALEVQCVRLQGVETSFKAQLRRKDTEYERLRKSLQLSIGVSAKEKKRGLSISKPLNGSTKRLIGRKQPEKSQKHPTR